MCYISLCFLSAYTLYIYIYIGMHVCMIQDVQLVQAHFSVRSRPKSHQKGGEFWFAKCRLHP